MRQHAQGTDVPVGRSRDEIERTLARFGATAQVWMRDDETGVVTVAFKREARAYRFTVPMPPLKDFEMTPSRKWIRTPEQAQSAKEAEVRRRFRSLANYVKALLDATDSGIIRADEALLPYLMLSDGETVYQRAAKQMKAGGEVSLAQALTAGEERRDDGR